MTAEAIAQRIEDEVAGDWSRSNAHGVNLRACLVSPTRKSFREHPDRLVELWLVLEEIRETCGGYKIVFDERCGRYALATADVNDSVDFYLGSYGTFLETIEAM
jgi:hypothetical protein